MEDQSIHIVGEICRGQYHVGPLDLDGPDEQAIAVLLVCKNMVDAGADRGLLAFARAVASASDCPQVMTAISR